MREAAAKEGKTDRMQMWAGQAAKLGSAEPAAEVTNRLWTGVKQMLDGTGAR